MNYSIKLNAVKLKNLLAAKEYSARLRLRHKILYSGVARVYNKDSCPCCLLDITASCKILQCGHFLHTSCLKEWRVFSKICPVCRERMVTR